jgi:GDPmannose 4,6-dehydratase
MWVSCGIMGNYESPFRGEEFVTKKIIRYLKSRVIGYAPPLKLGNIESFRDWTFAGDTMEAVYLMMQQDKPDNYVIGTGETNSVKTFLETAIDYLISLGYNINKDCYEIDPELFRPSEVPYLKMDSSKIRKLGWKPKENFKSLVEMMMLSELLS